MNFGFGFSACEWNLGIWIQRLRIKFEISIQRLRINFVRSWNVQVTFRAGCSVVYFACLLRFAYLVVFTELC